MNGGCGFVGRSCPSHLFIVSHLMVYGEALAAAVVAAILHWV